MGTAAILRIAAANLGMALKKLPSGVADRVKLVFVTTDPARDTCLS
jgi:cytochrome oxidase Cu insertion factor (SCO1/SenC/PrrC family)